MTTLRVLDLFSGLRGWSAPFAERGHETFAIDIDRRFSADAYLDIGDVAGVLSALPWRPDVTFASPPCNSFSTGSMGKMWQHGAHPAPKRSERHSDGHPIAIEGMRLVSATLRLIAVLRPRATGSSRTRGDGCAASTSWPASRVGPSGIAGSGSTGPSPPTSGASSRPGSDCRPSATTGTLTTSRHREAAAP